MRLWCAASPWLAVLHAIHLALVPASEAAATEQQGMLSFASFTEQYSRFYDGGLAEYKERQDLFNSRVAKVLEQNRQPNRRWTAAINAFADRTSSELGRLRGWRRVGSPNEQSRHRHGSSSAGRIGVPHTKQTLSLSQIGAHRSAPKSVSWAFLNSTKRHYNQGSCGSCWAIASAVLLEAHSEIHADDGKGRTFSAQELVSCVQNPKHCGGTGGCEGATIELAMDWTIKHGLADDVEVPYRADDGECRADKPVEGSSLLQIKEKHGVRSSPDPLVEGTEDGAKLMASMPGASFGMMSWERLPENKYDALLSAVQNGPVGISVAASDWFEYSHGIFDKCVKDAVIDHAVVLIGYGEDKEGEGYWLLKNSWGPDWGEHGLMRLLRRNGEEDEGKWCGTDRQPELGSGCEGGPSEVTVCGTCGILYDTVVPHWRGDSDKAKLRAVSPEQY